MVLLTVGHFCIIDFLATAVIAYHHLILHVIVEGVPGLPLRMLLYVLLTAEELCLGTLPGMRALQTEEADLLLFPAMAESEVVEVQVLLLD
jgi:hypothetical protein